MIISEPYWKWKHILILLAVALVCYWPLSSGIFSVKNDNVTAFLPLRFHISEAIRNAELPLWTPYVFLGFPLHGDMQGGAWNPFVWFLSFFGRYNATSLHAETILYIFLSGAGIYRLLAFTRIPAIVKLAGAVSYMLCGFVTDVAGSNILFLAAAAFIPFSLSYFYQLLKNLNVTNAVKAALAVWLLLVTSYPSFFIVVLYVFIAILLFKYFRKSTWKQFPLKYLGIMSLVFLLVSAPAITSYFHILPFYQRGEGLSLESVYHNSFDPSATLSAFFPPAPVKDNSIRSTDLISRNIYMNIFMSLFFLVALTNINRRHQKFALAGILFFYVFSLGSFTPLRAITYYMLPLFDSFRHPSNARLFVIIPLIIMASVSLHQYLASPRANHKALKWLLLFFVLFILSMITYHMKEISLFHIDDVAKVRLSFREKIKLVLEKMNFSDLVVTTGCTQLAFLSLFYLAVLKKKHLILPLVIANAVVLSQFSLMYTVASKTSPAEINQVINHAPVGFPVPSQEKAIGEYSVKDLQLKKIIFTPEFFQKTPALPEDIYTPTILLPVQAVYQNNLLNEIKKLPFAYLSKSFNIEMILPVNQSAGSYRVLTFKSNKMVFEINSPQPVLFCVQQVLLPGWKGKLNGRETELQLVNKAFIGISLPAGRNKVSLEYNPSYVYISIALSLIMMMISFFVLALKRVKF